MSINRILIINQQKNSESNTLTASINLPTQISDAVLDEVVSEFRAKLVHYTSIPMKKTFSSINRNNLVDVQPLQTQAQAIRNKSEHYQREVSTMKMDQVIESLKSLKVLEDRVVNFVTHEQGLAIKNKLQTISVAQNKATLNSQGSSITGLDVSDLVYNIHQIIDDESTLEDFSRRIYYTWESISF
jgi:hypothetical protein